MRAYLNEISGYGTPKNVAEITELLRDLVKLLKGLGIFGVRELGLPVYQHEFILAQGVSLDQWLRESRNPQAKLLKDILLGAIRIPAIEGENELLDKFEYSVHRIADAQSPYFGQEVKGLAIGSLASRPSISLKGNAYWDRAKISLEREDLDGRFPVVGINISTEEHFETHKAFLESLSDPELIVSNLDERQKPISLADHHGKDTLEAFAKKILRSPYTVEVICSLEMKSQAKNFIRKVHPDGTLDIVLTWTERGLAMKLRTTGRNFRETEAIAITLEEEFGQG